jgi:DNA mismatch repair protein MLH1
MYIYFIPVNWEEEKSCFDTCAKSIASFYAGEDDETGGEGDVNAGDDGENVVPPGEAVARARAEGAGIHPSGGDVNAGTGSGEDGAWRARHVLFPAMSRRLLPTRASASDGTVLQVACLEQLYRVFERC